MNYLQGVYSFANREIFGVAPPSKNPWAVPQLNSHFLQRNKSGQIDTGLFRTSRYIAPGTEMTDEKKKLTNEQGKTWQDENLARIHDLNYMKSSLTHNPQLIRKADDFFIDTAMQHAKSNWYDHGSLVKGLIQNFTHPSQLFHSIAESANDIADAAGIKLKEVGEDIGLKQYGYEKVNSNTKLLNQVNNQLSSLNNSLTKQGFSAQKF